MDTKLKNKEVKGWSVNIGGIYDKYNFPKYVLYSIEIPFTSYK